MDSQFGTYTSMLEEQARGQALLEKFASNDPQLIKEGADEVDDWTRLLMREEGILRRGAFPPIPIQNSDLDRSMNHHLPVKVVDKEPWSPPAVSVPILNQPTRFHIRGNRYEVPFFRVYSGRASVDVAELRTYRIDLRQVISDNMAKDILKEEDDRFFKLIKQLLKAKNTSLAFAGQAMWQGIKGGITRDGLFAMLEVMPSAYSKLEVATLVVNTVTAKKVKRFGMDELGGTRAQDIFFNGLSFDQFDGRKIIRTIKDDIIPDNHFFMLAAPQWLGKFYELEAPTMHVDSDHVLISFFLYEFIGMALANPNGAAIVEFE